MVPPKKKSKRVSVRLRHKIEKKSNEKQRKERRDAKKDPTWKSRTPKPLSIPNSFPYKEQLLADIEEQKKRKAEEEARKKEQRKLERLAKKQQNNAEDEDEELVDESEEEDNDEMMDDSDDEPAGNSAMAALLASAKSRAAEYEATHESDEDSDMSDSDGGIAPAKGDKQQVNFKDGSRRQFDKIFKEVVDAADVILYVLDARDPEGTRSRTVERDIMAASATSEKRLILVLNKVDLIPPSALQGWLTYLRRYFPTIPLKASKTSAPGAQTFNHKNLTATGTSTALLRSLKAYASSKQMKGRVSVGVIGYPNVGKSSVINALTSRVGGSNSACPTGAEAGLTTSLREIKLDKRLRLLDSPGIVFPSQSGSKASKKETQAKLALLSALPLKQVEDPIGAVQLLLKRLSQSESLFQSLLDVYGLPPLVTNISIAYLTKEFLTEVARKRGRLSKGGIPNIESAAMAVLMDWRDGRIKGWVEPPVTGGVVGERVQGWNSELGAQDEVKDTQIVTEWAKEFKIDGLWGTGEEEEIPQDDIMDEN